MESSGNIEGHGSVKFHLFLPSQKKIWTVVGKEGEYWVDPDLSFCSCKDYYFATLSGGEPCYHLKNVKRAVERGIDSVKFSDQDYPNFIRTLAAEAENVLR